MAKYMTEREVFEYRMGRRLTDEQIYNMAPMRYKADMVAQVSNSENLYRRCDICLEPFCVNNWPDRKPRTPKFKDFIVCHLCDPRPIDDRFMKQGYRIVWPARLRVIRYAQITRALARRGCIVPDWHENFGSDNCKCAGCAAVKLMGSHGEI